MLQRTGRGGAQRRAFELQRAHEGLAVDGGEIDHQPRRLARHGIEHECPVDSHRL
jgi:hypothetical protein